MKTAPPCTSCQSLFPSSNSPEPLTDQSISIMPKLPFPKGQNTDSANASVKGRGSPRNPSNEIVLENNPLIPKMQKKTEAIACSDLFSEPINQQQLELDAELLQEVELLFAALGKSFSTPEDNIRRFSKLTQTLKNFTFQDPNTKENTVKRLFECANNLTELHPKHSSPNYFLIDGIHLLLKSPIPAGFDKVSKNLSAFIPKNYLPLDELKPSELHALFNRDMSQLDLHRWQLFWLYSSINTGSKTARDTWIRLAQGNSQKNKKDVWQHWHNFNKSIKDPTKMDVLLNTWVKVLPLAGYFSNADISTLFNSKLIADLLKGSTAFPKEQELFYDTLLSVYLKCLKTSKKENLASKALSKHLEYCQTYKLPLQSKTRFDNELTLIKLFNKTLPQESISNFCKLFLNQLEQGICQDLFLEMFKPLLKKPQLFQDQDKSLLIKIVTLLRTQKLKKLHPKDWVEYAADLIKLGGQEATDEALYCCMQQVDEYHSASPELMKIQQTLLSKCSKIALAAYKKWLEEMLPPKQSVELISADLMSADRFVASIWLEIIQREIPFKTTEKNLVSFNKYYKFFFHKHPEISAAAIVLIENFFQAWSQQEVPMDHIRARILLDLRAIYTSLKKEFNHGPPVDDLLRTITQWIRNCSREELKKYIYKLNKMTLYKGGDEFPYLAIWWEVTQREMLSKTIDKKLSLWQERYTNLLRYHPEMARGAIDFIKAKIFEFIKTSTGNENKTYFSIFDTYKIFYPHFDGIINRGEKVDGFLLPANLEPEDLASVVSNISKFIQGSYKDPKLKDYENSTKQKEILESVLTIFHPSKLFYFIARNLIYTKSHRLPPEQVMKLFSNLRSVIHFLYMKHADKIDQFEDTFKRSAPEYLKKVHNSGEEKELHLDWFQQDILQAYYLISDESKEQTKVMFDEVSPELKINALKGVIDELLTNLTYSSVTQAGEICLGVGHYEFKDHASEYIAIVRKLFNSLKEYYKEDSNASFLIVTLLYCLTDSKTTTSSDWDYMLVAHRNEPCIGAGSKTDLDDVRDLLKEIFDFTFDYALPYVMNSWDHNEKTHQSILLFIATCIFAIHYFAYHNVYKDNAEYLKNISRMQKCLKEHFFESHTQHAIELNSSLVIKIEFFKSDYSFKILHLPPHEKQLLLEIMIEDLKIFCTYYKDNIPPENFNPAIEVAVRFFNEKALLLADAPGIEKLYKEMDVLKNLQAELLGPEQKNKNK